MARMELIKIFKLKELVNVDWVLSEEKGVKTMCYENGGSVGGNLVYHAHKAVVAGKGTAKGKGEKKGSTIRWKSGKIGLRKKKKSKVSWEGSDRSWTGGATIPTLNGRGNLKLCRKG